MNNKDAEKDLSTEQSPPGEETRFPCANGDEKWASSNSASPSERSQTPDSASLLETSETPENLPENLPDFTLPKAHRLRKPREFQQVYKNGKRFDGHFMSAFILPNDLSFHRLGITASRKGIGKAVSRNRAKRLLREAFRLSKIELQTLNGHYDFVLNARRSLLQIKMQEALADFHKLLAQIARHEKSLNNEKPPDVNLKAQ